MEFGLRNRNGERVDGAPFAVVTAAAFLVVFSFTPGYLITFGVSLAGSLLAATSAFAVCTAGAYYRYVWTAPTPERRAEVSPAYRLQRLGYGALILLLVLAGLSAVHFLR